MPYLPLLYRAVYAVTGTNHYLVWARLVTFLLVVLSAALVAAICAGKRRRLSDALTGVALFVFNPLVLRVMQESSNYVVPMTLSLGAFCLLTTGVTRPRFETIGLFLCGVLAALAVGAKLYYAILLPAFVLAMVVCRRSATCRAGAAWGLVAMLAGMAAGLLAAVSAGLALVGALVPTPSLLQYFAMPVVFAIIVVARGLASESGAGRRLLACAVFVSALFGVLPLFRYMGSVATTESWTGQAVHQVARQVRAAVGHAAAADKAATLSPCYVLEGGLGIYPELSTGPFLYGVGDLMTEHDRRRFVATSPTDLERLLDVDPPKAILVGFEGPLDQPFAQYANRHGYRQARGSFGGGVLLLRPD